MYCFVPTAIWSTIIRTAVSRSKTHRRTDPRLDSESAMGTFIYTLRLSLRPARSVWAGTTLRVNEFTSK